MLFFLYAFLFKANSYIYKWKTNVHEVSYSLGKQKCANVLINVKKYQIEFFRIFVHRINLCCNMLCRNIMLYVIISLKYL